MGKRTIAVLGDVQGHTPAFVDVLQQLNVNVKTGEIPAHLTVVQVGDLLHRGPDSVGVVNVVEKIRKANPHRWVQLVGNHESIYLPNGIPFVGYPQSSYILPDETVRIVQEWWKSGWMKTVAAIKISDVVFPRKKRDSFMFPSWGIISHAGITSQLWETFNGDPGVASHPDSVTGFVQEINRIAVNPTSEKEVRLVWGAGQMLDGGVPQRAAGPIWASCHELHEGWHQKETSHTGALPFHQIHGHSTEFNYRSNRWSYPFSMWKAVAAKTKQKPFFNVWIPEGIVRIDYTTHSIWGVDPGHGVHDTKPQWSPLILEGEIVF